jgi:signal recognition particle subunit SRP54
LKRMGSLRSVMEMMPGFNKLADMEGMDEALEGDSLKRVEAIILSMTFEERRNPDVINGSRRKRIAGGSGTTPQEINQLLEQFGEMRTMIRQVSSGKGPWAKMAKQFSKNGGGMPGMPGLPGMPDGMPALPSGSGSRGKKAGKAARKEKRKQRAKSRR